MWRIIIQSVPEGVIFDQHSVLNGDYLLCVSNIRTVLVPTVATDKIFLERVFLVAALGDDGD